MDQEDADKLEDVPLLLKPEGVWAVAIGPPSKRTLAGWHVTSPEEVVDAVESLI
jgi:trehalose 6-phosphate synthase/phosphatase